MLARPRRARAPTGRPPRRARPNWSGPRDPGASPVSAGCRGRRATADPTCPPRAETIRVCAPPCTRRYRSAERRRRSEEHTSELQSRRDLVCRLLLEKKKEKNIYPLLDYKKKKKK